MSHVYICMCTANAAVGAGVARMREQTGVCTYMIQYRQSRRCMCIPYRTAHHTSSTHRSSAQQCMHPCACTEESRDPRRPSTPHACISAAATCMHACSIIAASQWQRLLRPISFQRCQLLGHAARLLRRRLHHWRLLRLERLFDACHVASSRCARSHRPSSVAGGQVACDVAAASPPSSTSAHPAPWSSGDSIVGPRVCSRSLNPNQVQGIPQPHFHDSGDP
jgi:hypothetical protein